MALSLTGLTVNEINIGNQKLKGSGTDLETAITQGGPGRFHAIAVLVWLYRRRTDPTADLAALLDTTADDLVEELTADDDPAAGQTAEDPTEPTP